MWTHPTTTSRAIAVSPAGSTPPCSPIKAAIASWQIISASLPTNSTANQFKWRPMRPVFSTIVPMPIGQMRIQRNSSRFRRTLAPIRRPRSSGAGPISSAATHWSRRCCWLLFVQCKRHGGRRQPMQVDLIDLFISKCVCFKSPIPCRTTQRQPTQKKQTKEKEKEKATSQSQMMTQNNFNNKTDQ